MPIEIIASNSPWNEKTHTQHIESWDPIEIHVRFDQPIVHELEYMDKDVTLFWVEVELAGQPVSSLVANRVLPELQDEARTFRNGNFRFSLCKQPDALSQNFHARFARTAAAMASGIYPVTLTLFSDNELQQRRPLATGAFTFEIAAGSADFLTQVAAENDAQGADQVDDAAAKAEKYAKLWHHRGPAATDGTQVRVKLAAREADTRVRIHHGGGRTMAVTVQKHVESDWHEVADGSTIDLFDGVDQKVRTLVTVNLAMSGTTLTVG